MQTTTLALVTQPDVLPAEALATDRALLAEAQLTGRGGLRCWTMPGDWIGIGRHHRTPSRKERVWRRWSGGPPVVCGDGFFGVTLVLPHRSALVSADPHALAPAQVLNRAIRGVMQALEAVGVPAYYPGRERVTCGGREVAMVSFAVEPGGGTIVEMIVSSMRDVSCLALIADATDPQGVVPVSMVDPGTVTSIGAHTGRDVPLDEWTEAVAEGYRRASGVTIVPWDGTPMAVDHASWRSGGAMTHPTARRSRQSIMLGVLEVGLDLRQDHTIERLVLLGDAILDVTTRDAIGDAVVGSCADRAELLERIAPICGRPEAIVLGIDPRDPAGAIADAIARAAA